MGKIPASFRSAISSSLTKNPSSLLATESSASTAIQPSKSPYFPKKTPSQLSRKVAKSRENGIPENPMKRSIFKSPNLTEAKKIYNKIVTNSNVALGLPFHNSLLQSYASVSAFEDSIALLRHMIDTLPSFSPDRSTFHILLSQASRTPDSNLIPIQKALDLMVSNGLNPDKATTDVVVRSLCLAGRLEDAVELIKELSVKHTAPDTYTFNFVVKHLCKSQSLSSVYQFIEEMRNSFDMKPDLVTYTILIDNVCNTKNLREALRLVSVLSEEGFKPDTYVYNTIMKGYCSLSRGSEVIEVYNKMKDEGVDPDLVTYNTLIYGLSKSGRVREAKKFLDIMVEKGHTPDAVTYTSLMNGMCRKGEALGAMALLEEMESKGCSPNSCTYNTLLYGLCKARILDRGIELYGMMKLGGIKLESDSYATLVRALCRNGKVAEAYEVFDYAVESKSLTDVAAYSGLESTLKWLQKAREQGLAI